RRRPCPDAGGEGGAARVGLARGGLPRPHALLLLDHGHGRRHRDRHDPDRGHGDRGRLLLDRALRLRLPEQPAGRHPDPLRLALGDPVRRRGRDHLHGPRGAPPDARARHHEPAVIAGLGQVHSSEIIRPWDDGRGGGREAAEVAYRMAGCSAPDIDVVQLYDGFTPLVMHELVAYGFASWDEVGALVEAGELDVGGRVPANTAGGLLSEGHLSGFGHVAEAVRQIRGTSHCQVPDVELSMVTGYGGAPHEPPPTVAYTVAVLRA